MLYIVNGIVRTEEVTKSTHSFFFPPFLFWKTTRKRNGKIYDQGGCVNGGKTDGKLLQHDVVKYTSKELITQTHDTTKEILWLTKFCITIKSE